VQAKYYNQHVRAVCQDLSGCSALLRDFVGPAVIVSMLSPAPAPCAYYVRLPSGVVTVRNQSFLRPLPRSVAVSPTSSPAVVTGTVPGRFPVVSPAYVTASNGRNARLPLDVSPTPSSPPTAFHRQLTSVRPSLRPSLTQSVTGSTASPRPSLTTGSRSSYDPVSPDRQSGAWASAHSEPCLSLTPERPASPVTVPRSPLGVTRAGRMVFPSLRVTESQATGQWNPRSIVSRPQPLDPPPHLPSTTAALPPPLGLPPPP
jgi:hypothetical protein